MQKTPNMVFYIWGVWCVKWQKSRVCRFVFGSLVGGFFNPAKKSKNTQTCFWTFVFIDGKWQKLPATRGNFAICPCPLVGACLQNQKKTPKQFLHIGVYWGALNGKNFPSAELFSINRYCHPGSLFLTAKS